MATPLEELENFHQYAARRLEESDSQPSLDELLMEWADSRDRMAINEAIGRGIADVDARRHERADLAMGRIRREFGFPDE